MFNLLYLIPLFPFLAFVLIVLWANPNKKLSHSLAIGGIALSWLVSWATFFQAVVTPHFGEEPVRLAFEWFPTGSTWFETGVMVDALTAIMLFMVPFVCMMIFIYSVGYMGHGTEHVDPRYSRFFAYISLFATGMLGLIIADNLLLLFIFWEIMGLCSYLLIGFWFEKTYPNPRQITPKQAGLKAFLTTRVGDVIMLLGMLFLYSQVGNLTFEHIFSVEVLRRLAETTVTLPLVGAVPMATVMAVLIFGGAVGKSAQFPLHVWLPDAMEGPTPVSALIHAATMVSAGVYLVVRMFPLFAAGLEPGHGITTAMTVVAFIGAFTALFASTIAVAQNDIKKVLAYSTISQLGYMIAALGIGAYVAAAFHLITHAFFKALLFLGSGSVIIGSHHEQDMMEMGGLRRRMPITFWTFVAGGLALSGFPIITAGFWSKDEILAHAWEGFMHEGVASWPFFVWLLLTIAAFLTAFYTGRQICLTFLGEPRSHHAEHAHETPRSMTVPLILLAVFALTLGFAGIPEEIIGEGRNWFHHFVGHQYAATPLSVPVMLLSTVLAVGGLFLGWLVYGRRPLAAGQPDPLTKALGPVHTVLKNKYYFDELYQATFVRGAIGLGHLLFRFDNQWVLDPIVNGVGRLGVVLANAFFRFVDMPLIDGAVNLAGRAGAALSAAWDWIDLHIVDGLVNLAGWLTERVGRALRLIQTGRVQQYALLAFAALVALVALYLFR
jgi:NADH-quinone oxidoreductase subunit L